MRRVVVTGLGLVTPLGGDVETTWANILASKSGAGTITRFDASDQKCRIACEVKGADHEYGFDPNKRVDHKVQRQVDPFIVFGIDAAGQAIEDAGLTDMDEATRFRAGVSIGSGIGGLPGSIESEDDERVDLPLGLVIDPLTGIEAIFVVCGLHFARDSAFLVARVELGDRPSAALARKDVAPAGLHVRSKRRHQSQSRHYDTAHSSFSVVHKQTASRFVREAVRAAHRQFGRLTPPDQLWFWSI